MSARLGFIISAYHRPAQLARLVSRIAGPGRACVVHVDRRAASEVHAAIEGGIGGRPGVTLLPSHACHWGDFGHVRASLAGLRALAAGGDLPDYTILLTGQDYPIKPSGHIEAFFASAAGRSFMNFRPLPIDGLPAGGYDRLDRWHWWSRGRARVFAATVGGDLVRRRVPGGLRPYFGSGYWCLHRRAAEHVLDFVRRHPRYVRFFERAYVPDEMFFQTILLNSPLAGTVVNDDLRYIRWPGPAVLTAADLPALRGTSDLFARKFDEAVDAGVLDAIDADIGAGL